MITVDTDGTIVITLGSPEAAPGEGRIVAIEDGVVAFLEHRRRVLERRA